MYLKKYQYEVIKTMKSVVRQFIIPFSTHILTSKLITNIWLYVNSQNNSFLN